MNTSNMQDKEVLSRLYQDSTNLDFRKNFHRKYGTSPIAYTDWILSNIRFTAGCRVLEVGCGTGSLWAARPELIDSFSELLLTDLSEGMVDLARKQYAGRKNVQARVMDILEIPYAERSFDIVVANSMLYHIHDVGAALAQVRRVLRDQGRFYATTFGRQAMIYYVHDALVRMGLADAGGLGEVSFTVENGADLLRKHFSTVEIVTHENHLEVSKPPDLVEYIFSMASMSHLDRAHRDKILAYFEGIKDSRGHITIPQTYGMFICSVQ